MAGTNGNGQAAPPKITINSLEDLSKLHAAEMAGRQATRQDMVRKALSLTNNLGGADLVRGNLLNFLLDGPRDIDAECGYPPWLTPDHYRFMYDREGIARRVVDCEPEETWSMDPALFESDDPETETKFEGAWNELAEQYNVWHYLQRIDVLSGIGQFGVLFLGIDDGRDMREPVDGVNDDGSIEPGTAHKLLYLRTFDESVVFVKVREIDPASPRYSMPKMYTVQFRDYPNWGVQAGEIIARDIHWSRVIHVADNRKMSEVYGIPRMQPVYNRLYDLRKIYSSSGEAFWKGAFPGLAFEVNPELADQGVELDTKSIREEMERFQNGTQRYLAITGVSAKSLPPEIVDPMGTAETHLKAIAIAKDIPYRVLFGSEEAVLAGNQDSRKWNKKIARRQAKYCNPLLIRPFVDRLIGMGVLPPPKTPYQIEWPDLNAPTDEDKANIASLETQAMAAYVQGGVSSLMAPREYLTHVLEYDPGEADAILEASTEFAGDEDEPLSIAGQTAMQMEQMEAEAALAPQPAAGGTAGGKGGKGGAGGKPAAKGGRKGAKKQNTRPTRNEAGLVENAWNVNPPEEYYSIGHPSPGRPANASLWALHEGKIHTADVNGGEHGLDHGYAFAPEELHTYGRIDHDQKKISMLGDERRSAYAARLLAKKYPDYTIHHFGPAGAEIPREPVENTGAGGPRGDSEGMETNAAHPAEQILRNPDKPALQALLDTVHAHNEERNFEYSPLKIVLRGAASADGSVHHWGSSFDHDHSDLKQGDKSLENHLYVTTAGQIARIGRSGGLEPAPVPGIGSKLKPVKALVANAEEERIKDASSTIMHNPDKGSLQALFDTVHHGMVMSGSINPSRPDPYDAVLRGAVSRGGERHVWGNAVRFEHEELKDAAHAINPRPELRTHVYASPDGQIWKLGPRMERQSVDVPGIGNKLKPARAMVANVEPSRKHGRDAQDDADEDADEDDLNRNPGANPDNGDASWTPNLAREGVKHPVEYDHIILPSINEAGEPDEPEETEI